MFWEQWIKWRWLCAFIVGQCAQPRRNSRAITGKATNKCSEEEKAARSIFLKNRRHRSATPPSLFTFLPPSLCSLISRFTITAVCRVAQFRLLNGWTVYRRTVYFYSVYRFRFMNNSVYRFRLPFKRPFNSVFQNFGNFVQNSDNFVKNLKFSTVEKWKILFCLCAIHIHYDYEL